MRTVAEEKEKRASTSKRSVDRIFSRDLPNTILPRARRSVSLADLTEPQARLSRGIIMFRTDIAMPWAVASSCIERNGSPLSTPPVWCFRQTPVATRSVVNLRTVRRLNRNANLYASPDLRAAHLFLADDCGCLEIADIFVEARVIWIFRHFGEVKGNFWIIWRVIWFKSHIL